MKTILLTIPNGQSVRDFIVLGILDTLLDIDPSIQIVLSTPGHNVPGFQCLIKTLRNCDRIHVSRSECPTSCGNNSRFVRFRNKLRSRLFRRLIHNCETKNFEVPPYVDAAFDEWAPNVLVLTHPMTSFDYPEYMAARKRGIPVLGILKSWDNVQKGLVCLPDKLSVWNHINAEEASDLLGYKGSDVVVNGAVAFDPYFCEGPDDRDFLYERFNVPRGAKIVTYATSGVYNLEYYFRDETHLAEELLDILGSDKELADSHLIIRLHPASRLEEFQAVLGKHPRVSYSCGDFMPSIGWYVSAEGLRIQRALLSCSDLVVTPCSSWAIEAAIFDTPVVCPVYATRQPEHAAAQFDRYTLKKHFAAIARDELLPLPRSRDELRQHVVKALDDPATNSSNRKEIVDRYVTFQDNQSHVRIAQWLHQCS